MTTSVFSDQVNQELSLDGTTSINDDLIDFLPAVLDVVTASLVKDVVEGDELGTSLGEVIDDLVQSGGLNGDGEVKTVYK